MGSASLGIGSLRFGEPLYLWLLCAPGILLLLWTWRLIARRADARRYAASRLLPVSERFSVMGELSFWLCAIAALTLCILSVARPQGSVSVLRDAGIDIVILQDGSTSMRVSDVRPDRWQRAMAWVRTFAESLSWNGDRMALATFANIATPQIRLTRDPNTIFFFLDHLSDEPTFRLRDDPSWDTNVEEAIYWGLKLVDADASTYGRNTNAKAFVVISDGQVWSGEVSRSIAQAVRRGIRIHVIGVGTPAGGMIPEPYDDFGQVPVDFVPIRASLDRQSLREIARAGGGEYFELGTVPDGEIAVRIIDNVRRRSPSKKVQESFDELYWYALVAAAGFLALGAVFLKQRLQLGLQFAAALALLSILARLSR